MDSQTLLTAEELGVFAALDDGPRTAGELAQKVGLPATSTERLLTALCSLELIRRVGDRFANSPEAAAQLVPGKPGYIGSMFRHVRDDLYPVWRYFKSALRENCAQWGREAATSGGQRKDEQKHEDPESLRAFMEGMHAITYHAAQEFAAQADELQDVRSLVDLGGAAGSFLIALAERFAQLRGTVFDLPMVAPIAADFLDRHGLSERLSFQSGDFFRDAFPPGYDAYALGFILHDWDTGACRMLLDKVAAASRSGARLIVGEYLLNDDKTGPHHVARLDLNMLVAARGRERNLAEYAALLQNAGFSMRNVYHTSEGKAFLFAERD